MTDTLTSRLVAYDHDGQLVAWTPEAVQGRMIEAALVVSRTPARIGPSAFNTAWPEIVVVAKDLIDEQTQERILNYRKFDGNWEKYIDPHTMRRLSEHIQEKWKRPSSPSAEAYTRAEEALLWPARYLAGRPLFADALTLWAFCVATGASMRATCRERRAEIYNLRTAPKSAQRSVSAPEKNLHHQHIPQRRRDAAAVISARLNAGGIAVRAAAEDIRPADGE